MYHLHSVNLLAHLDIKPDNLLIILKNDLPYLIGLIDFGLSSSNAKLVERMSGTN